jgi:hypothetical protein
MKNLIILFALILFSCKKDNNTKDTITISGITERDNFGNPIGIIDDTDWSYDTNFPQTINSLLNFVDTVNYLDADTSTIQLFAYPNPIEKQFVFRFSSSKRTVLKYIIVDEFLNLYLKRCFKLRNGGEYMTNILTDDSIYPPKRFYRLFYAFYDHEKTIYFKGHGDLWKNK